jgi:hypothetical protein
MSVSAAVSALQGIVAAVPIEPSAGVQETGGVGHVPESGNFSYFQIVLPV